MLVYHQFNFLHFLIYFASATRFLFVELEESLLFRKKQFLEKNRQSFKLGPLQEAITDIQKAIQEHFSDLRFIEEQR